MANRRKRRYLPNHWGAIKDTPSSFFPPMPYIQLMDWKVAGWILPSSVECILRIKNLDTLLVTEHTYLNRGYAERKVQKLISQGGAYEFTVVDHDEIHSLYPEPLL